MNTIASLIEHLRLDPWRAQKGFSSDLESANNQLYDADSESAIPILNQWIARYQPCLFGKMAARLNRIHYCVLTERDLSESDRHIQKRIQAARLEWNQRGHDGEKSGFVIAAISRKIATAIPDQTLQELASRLASLYLLTEVTPDRIYLDSLCLEKPGSPPAVWKWSVGVNYFSSQGDGRWWQDHRIPAGMAFSMNSVGHMTKVGALANAMKVLDGSLGLPVTDGHDNLNDLGQALNLAMRTIANASQSVSGPATFLLPESVDDMALRPACPIKLTPPIVGHSHCQYAGWYHTDVTVPSPYFDPTITRPSSVPKHTLDFTYLFHDELDNPDHLTAGAGLRIRDDDDEDEPTNISPTKMNPVECPREEYSQLLQTMARLINE